MVFRRVRSLGLYFLDKTKYVIPTLTTGFQLYTLSAGVSFFIAGALSCAISVKLLKKLLRQPRPSGTSQKVTYGMPSTHAAVISYYASYVSIACIALPLHDSLRPLVRNDPNTFTTLVPVTATAWASYVVLSRLWLGHHTRNQIAVGVGYGVCFAGIWFALWTQGGLNVLGAQCEKRVLQILQL